MQVDRSLLFINKAAMLERIAEALDNRLDFNTNVDCKIVDVPDSGPADTVLLVTHNLGRIPTFYLYNIDQAGIVYDGDLLNWTTTEIEIKCSVSNAVLRMIIL